MESGATSDEEDLYKLLMQGYDFDEDEDDDDDYVDALVPDEALRDAATLASSRRKRSGSDDEDESGAATEASSVADDDDDDSDDSHCTNKQRLAFEVVLVLVLPDQRACQSAKCCSTLNFLR